MKIIFLIAGRGSRLNTLTKRTHKALLKINGKPIIQRLVNQFHLFGIKKKNITFITGYKSQQIEREFGKDYNYFYYSNYNSTNNLHTLINAKKILTNQDTIICFSDILTTNKVIKKIAVKKISKITILADLSYVRNGTMKVIVSKNNLKSIGKLSRKDSSGNYIGIVRIPREKMKIFRKYLIKSENKNKKSYFTEILNDLIYKNEKIKVKNVAKNYWIEIDNMNDFKKAKKQEYLLND